MKRSPRAGIRQPPAPPRPARPGRPGRPARPASALSLRMNLAGSVGRRMRYAGVKFGRKAVRDLDQLPNYDNYRGAMRGAGFYLKRRPRKNPL